MPVREEQRAHGPGGIGPGVVECHLLPSVPGPDEHRDVEVEGRSCCTYEALVRPKCRPAGGRQVLVGTEWWGAPICALASKWVWDPVARPLCESTPQLADRCLSHGKGRRFNIQDGLATQVGVHGGDDAEAAVPTAAEVPYDCTAGARGRRAAPQRVL